MDKKTALPSIEPLAPLPEEKVVSMHCACGALIEIMTKHSSDNDRVHAFSCPSCDAPHELSAAIPIRQKDVRLLGTFRKRHTPS